MIQKPGWNYPGFRDPRSETRRLRRFIVTGKYISLSTRLSTVDSSIMPTPASDAAAAPAPAASGSNVPHQPKPRRSSNINNNIKKFPKHSSTRNMGDASDKTNGIATEPAPYTGITPSHVAKTKLNEIFEGLPDKDLAAVTRTYTSRLHQMRLQRDQRRSTHERLTGSNNGGEQYLPSSCVFQFSLGAGTAVQAREGYAALKQKVDSTLLHCQTTLAQAIGELQVLEMEIKEEEIAKTFCEGLSKMGVAFINYHRDSPAAGIAKTMQSQRLADRLVELMLEKNAEILEFSYLLGENNGKAKSADDSKKVSADNGASCPLAHNVVLKKYYEQIGRSMPTHSRQQNRDAESSPYNERHTTFLLGIEKEFEDIVRPCFHTAWKDYLTAREKINKGEITGTKEVAHGTPHNGSTANPSKDDRVITKVMLKRNSLRQVEATPAPAMPTPEALKEMVQMAVSEETQALRDSLRMLEKQVKGTGATDQKKSGTAENKKGGAATTYAAAAAGSSATPKSGQRAGGEPAAANNKSKRQRNRNKKNTNQAPGTNEQKEGGNKKNGAKEGNDNAKKPAAAKSGAQANKGSTPVATSKNRNQNKNKGNNADATSSAGASEGAPKTATPRGDNVKIETKEENGKKKEIAAPQVPENGTTNDVNVKKAKESRPSVTTMNSMHDSTTVLFGNFDTAGDKKWG